MVTQGRRALALAGLTAGMMLVAAAPAAAQAPPPCPVQPPPTGAAAGLYDPSLPQSPTNTPPTVGTLVATSTSPLDPNPTASNRGAAGVAFALTPAWADPDGRIEYYCSRHGDPNGGPFNRRPANNPNSEHFFSRGGQYQVERFAVDNNGFKSATAQLSIYINDPPLADLGWSRNPQPNVPVTFMSQSLDNGDTNGSGGIKGVNWDFDNDGLFDDGTLSTMDHTFPSAGLYVVRLEVTDNADSRRRSSPRCVNVGAVPKDPASCAPPRPPALPSAAATASAPGAAVAPATQAAPAQPSQSTASRARQRGACANVIRGTARNDTLSGTSGGDRILGLGGGDVLSGASGDDCLLGGAGDDKLTGGSGRDTLAGGAGKDRLTGGPGDDRLTGAAGADIMAGGAGTNRYSAGGGNDTVNSANGKRETVSCGGGRDVVRADAADRLRGCERVTRT